VTNSYERLEYLGDAVLDYLISTIIISSESLDVLDPGRITDIRYFPARTSFFL
jgi:dsRNA-specific ribonuclease